MATLWILSQVLLLLTGLLVVEGQAPQRKDFCPDYGTLLYEVAAHCLGETTGPFGHFYHGDAKSLEQTLTTDQFWKSYCSGLDNFESCVLNSGGGYWGNCSDIHKADYVKVGLDDVTQSLAQAGLYPEPEVICDGPNLAQEISQLYSRVDAGDFSHCAGGEEIQKCLQPWIEEAGHYGDQGVAYTDVELQLATRWAEATYHCLLKARNQCNSASQDLLFFIFNQTIPTPIKSNLVLKNSTAPATNSGIFSMSRRSTVGVFGDPHLRIYKTGGFVTCAAENTREYLDHPRIKVSGINQRITVNGRQTSATFLTEIKITILDPNGYKWVGYEASSTSESALPVTLDNGNMNFKTDYGDITIRQKPTGVVILVEPLAAIFRISNSTFGPTTFYTFTMRMGDALFDEAGGLLVTGCSSNQRLNTLNPQNVVGKRKRRSLQEEKCRDICSDSENIGGFRYNDTCYFDCVVTGDTQVGMISMSFAGYVNYIAEDDVSFNLMDDNISPTSDTSTPTSFACMPTANSYISTIVCIFLIPIRMFL